MPPDVRGNLRQEYSSGLHLYCAQGGEPALLGAYHLGRRAARSGCGVLEIAALHEDLVSELVAGRPPFVGTSAVDVAWQHLRAQRVPPSSFVDGIPDALDRLVLSLLEKQPRDRPGHADDVAEALEDLGAAREGHRTPPRSWDN